MWPAVRLRGVGFRGLGFTRRVHLQGGFRIGVYKKSSFWHKNAIQVLEGLWLCCQSAGTCLFVMMRAIHWSLVGMIEATFLNSPLIVSQDGVVDL